MNREKKAPPLGRNGKAGQGIGVDVYGGPVVDPTANVRHEVEQAILRVDDMMELRAQLADEKIQRMEREWVHLDRLQEMRGIYEEKLRQAEAARLDSIRQVDREDVNKTATLNMSAIHTLQTQTITMAETLRTQVANTATTLANQLAQLFAESNKRVSALELTSSEGRGKQAVADPAMERLAAMVEKLAQFQQAGAGKSEGLHMGWVLIGGAISMVVGLLLIATTLYAVLKP